MKRDTLDDGAAGAAERALYRAARRETPDPSARARTLEALRGEAIVSTPRWGDASEEAPPTLGPWWRSGGLLACAVAVTALVLVVAKTRAPRTFSPTADVVGYVTEGPAPPAPVASRPSLPDGPLPAPSPAAPPRITTASPPRVPKAAKAPPLPSLSDEIDALDRARGALAKHDAGRALDVLDEYDHVLGGQRLRDDATLLRIEALEASDRHDAAAALARRFVTENPDSPLGDRALRLVGAGRSPPTTAEPAP